MVEIKPFPKYDELKEKVIQNKSEVIDLRKICFTINSMHQRIMSNDNTEAGRKEVMEHLYAIFALIYHHYITESNGVVFGSIPYGSKTLDGGKTHSFTMTNFPPTLQHIIAKYIMDIAK